MGFPYKSDRVTPRKFAENSQEVAETFFHSMIFLSMIFGPAL